MNYPNQGIRRWLLPAIVILGAAVISVALIYPSLVADPGAEIEPTLPPELSPAATLASPSTIATPAPTLEEPASSTPTATPTSNCTYTMYYWLDNPDAWLVSNVEINGRSYTQAEAFSVLGSASNDTRTRVLQQFFAAFLNTLKGANAGAIRSTINDASAWISAHPPSQTLNDTDRLDGETLAAELDAYNNGVIGPGHCSNEPEPPAPTPTSTPTITPTSTATANLPVFIPSPTPTKTEKPGGGGSGPKPTNTPQPTSPPATQPPTQPPPPPTEPPPPTSAPTAPPPTAAPPPTDSPNLPLPTLSFLP